MSPQMMTTDAYPSRVDDQPRLIDRTDPVLHAGPDAPGPLTAEQLQRFDRDGFLILPDFLSPPQLDACLAELELLRHNDAIKRRAEAIVEPQSHDLRSLFAVHRISDFFRDLTADPRIVPIAEQILGSQVAIHQSRINLKPGFRGKEFYWHSDFETWHVEDGMPRMRAVSFSILLTPNHSYNGPLMLVPGSHRKYVACAGQTPQNNYKQSLKRQELGVPDDDLLAELVDDAGGITTATGAPGTLVIFDCNTMHGSGSNISPLPRSNVFFVYNSVDNALVDPYCGLDPRPEFIGAREHVEPVGTK